MTRILIVACCALALGAGCQSGPSSNDGTPAPEVVGGVQRDAIGAFNALTSSIVEANGDIRQGGQDVAITLVYTTVAPDRLAYRSRSAVDGRTTEIGVISIPPDAWDLENGEWTPFAVASLGTFSADRMWRLVPFDEAVFVGEEPVNGRTARHFRASVSIELPLEEAAGSLVAADDIEFSGSVDRAEIEYWVASDEGVPLRAEYHLTGDATVDLTATLTKADDPSIGVDPPPP